VKGFNIEKGSPPIRGLNRFGERFAQVDVIEYDSRFKRTLKDLRFTDVVLQSIVATSDDPPSEIYGFHYTSLTEIYAPSPGY
jgi:hypothetical protein